MKSTTTILAIGATALLGLAGCATHPVNPAMTQVVPGGGYRYESREKQFRDHENLIILAFSGGGTRAAAFSYGVLQALRDVEAVDSKGQKDRLIDNVGVVAGVSGGSFTALAYGLYGDQLFDQYEKRFLKRDVQGELMKRLFNPVYWGPLSSPTWGRSELAADFYDEILFDGATFADLNKKSGPMIVATATDVSSGARFYYTQVMFDILCSDLSGVRLSRAAASSSAVPVVLSPITINNYGGTCGFHEPPWLNLIANPQRPIRPAARTMQQMNELRSYQDGKDRPYLHLVDGGVSDNLAMRGVMDVMDNFEALRLIGLPTPIDHLKRIIVVVVNSLSKAPTTWDKQDAAPGTFDVLMQASGVPIDHYSYEAVEQLRDTAARWAMLRGIRDSGAITDKSNPALLDVMRVPNAEITVVDVSFARLKDAKEREYLNELPTSFVLPPEAVDRLSAAAGTILLESPDFQKFVKDIGGKVVAGPKRPGTPAP